MVRKIGYASVLMVLLGCAATPQEIRDTTPFGPITLPMNYRQSAACVANSLESYETSSLNSVGNFHDLRYYEDPDFAEVLGRVNNVLVYVIKLTPVSDDSTGMETRIWQSTIARSNLYNDILDATQGCQQGVSPQL